MYQKNNTPNFNNEQSFVSKTTCINKSVKHFSVYDDYQYNKMKPKYEQPEILFHSSLIDPNELLKQQICELQRQLKVKELSYDSIATAYYQSQNQVEELKYALKVQEEKQFIQQQEMSAQIEKNNFRQHDVKQCQEINTLFQHENTQLKLTTLKQKDAIISLQTENRQLKEQIELLMISGEKKDSSKQSLDLYISEIDQPSHYQAKSVSILPTCDKKSNIDKRIEHLLAEISKYQISIAEKDSLIAKLTQQNTSIVQTQAKLQKNQKKTNLFGTPETEDKKTNPILVKDDSNDTFQKLNSCLSDKRYNNNFQESQAPLRTSSSLRSVMLNKSKQEVQQIYQKMNQSALFTASIYSTILDYKNLHQNFWQLGSKGQNKIKQL